MVESFPNFRSYQGGLPQSAPRLKGSGGGDTLDPMDARVTALEEGFKEMRTDMKSVLQALSDMRVDMAKLTGAVNAMSAKVEAAPSGKEFGELKGKVDALPTMQKIGTWFTIIGVLIAALANWDRIAKALHLG